MQSFSNLLSYGGIVPYLCLLVLLLRGSLTRYFPLFLFNVFYLACIGADLWALRHGLDSNQYFNVYWGSELLLDLLLFFLVISLTVRALEGSVLRLPATRLLLVILAVVIVIPFVAFEARPFSTRWNNRVTELFNFAAAIMTLILWTALLANRCRDRQLLTVSAGLGFVLAGAALTMALRHFTLSGTAGREITDYAHRILNITGVTIWCWAFRPARKLAPAREPTASAG